MPPLKAAWCCQHVSGFRYADETRQLVASERARIDRRGRALHGRSHPRRSTPGSDRRRAHNRRPVREIAGLRLDPFRREVYRDGRYVALTRKQFGVLEVLVAAEGGVVSAEELLTRAWDENADPFTNAVRITVSGLRKRLGEPWIIATVAGAGYRIDAESGDGREGGARG